jgi:hypothetical protein
VVRAGLFDVSNPTIDDQCLAGDVTGLVAGKEKCRVADMTRVAQALQLDRGRCLVK